MTIEIRQLIIRAVVQEAPEAVPGGAVGPAAGSPPAPPPAWPGLPEEERRALMAACVREVLRKIERARER
jgi:Family of unknown function (DUF5908)